MNNILPDIYRHLEKKAYYFNFIFILGYVLLFKYLPLQDYPVWVYEGFVFKELIAGSPLFQNNYVFIGYLPPNALSTIFIGSLSFIVSPIIAGKLFLLLSSLLLYTGIYKFMKLYLKNNDLLISVISLICTFNFSFFTGNINFIFGLGFAFYSAYFLIKNNKHNFLIYSLIFILAYLAHFFSIFILSFYIFIYLYKNKKKKLKIFFFSLIPPAAIFLHYMFNKNLPAEYNKFSMCTLTNYPVIQNKCTLLHFLLDKMALFFKQFQPLPSFGEVFELNTFLIAINVAVVLCFGFLYFKFFKIFLKNKEIDEHSITVLAFSLLIFLLPAFFGGISNPAERLIIFSFLNLIVFILKYRKDLKKLLVFFFILIEILSFSYFNLVTWKFNKLISSHAPVTAEYVRAGHNGFQFFDFYRSITNKEIADIFPTSIIKKIQK